MLIRPPAAWCFVGLLAAAATFVFADARPVDAQALDSLTAKAPFVTRRGDQLFAGDTPLRFVSFNIPNLHLAEDAYTFQGGSPWRWPNDYEIADALETVRQMNGQVVRCYVLSVRREASDMGDHFHVTGPGEFNEQAFVALDRVLKIAGEKRIRVVVPLVDNWTWWGGTAQYAAFRGKEPAEFWTDRQVIADFKRTIDFILNRRNTLTGVRYRDDPAVLGWETGNELDSPYQWTKEIAAYLKSIDPHHLVIDGNSLDGFTRESIDDPHIDVITTHHYPNRGEDIPQTIREAIRMTAGKKPYFVGEVGFLPTDELQQIVDIVADTHAAGVLFWSIRSHRREGGFYWHSEGSSGYKAYHWPGFASGNEYDETNVLRMARESSFRLRGERVTPVPVPAAPRLLPTNDPSQISWQGAAGAAGYTIQRAAKREGPWSDIATDVSDAATTHGALFNDQSAAMEEANFYRVIGANASGQSAPSNVLGPIVARHRRLVLEFESLDQSIDSSGDVALVSENARQLQEDFHRVKLAPGASVTYELPGEVFNAVAYAFSSEDAALEIDLVSAKSGSRRSLPIESKSFPQSSGDYGYLTPICFEATAEAVDAQRIIIRASATNTAPIQISRVEILHSRADQSVGNN